MTKNNFHNSKTLFVYDRQNKTNIINSIFMSNVLEEILGSDYFNNEDELYGFAMPKMKAQIYYHDNNDVDEKIVGSITYNDIPFIDFIAVYDYQNETKDGYEREFKTSVSNVAVYREFIADLHVEKLKKINNIEINILEDTIFKISDGEIIEKNHEGNIAGFSDKNGIYYLNNNDGLKLVENRDTIERKEQDTTVDKFLEFFEDKSGLNFKSENNFNYGNVLLGGVILKYYVVSDESRKRLGKTLEGAFETNFDKLESKSQIILNKDNKEEFMRFFRQSLNTVEHENDLTIV